MGFLEHVGVEIGSQDATARTTTDENAENASGGVHGGLIATLLDSAMGRAVREEMDEEKAAVTVQISITYLEGAKPGDGLVARASVKKMTRALAIVEAELFREGEDEPLAQGQATFAITDKD